MSISKSASSKLGSVNISPHCHLDPVAYVKGDHLLTLESAVVVHPRSKLFTDGGPVTVQEGSMISEKCTIGTVSGGDPTTLHRGLQGSSSSKSISLPAGHIIQKSNTDTNESVQDQSNVQQGLPIIIGKSVYVHPNVNIQPPCTVSDYAIVESGVTFMPGCTIGTHSKICAGVTLPTGTNVPSWTVVYGTNGSMRRKRHKDLSEEARLEGLNRERIAAFNLLRANATINKLASTSSTSTSREKRQSVMLG